MDWVRIGCDRVRIGAVPERKLDWRSIALIFAASSIADDCKIVGKFNLIKGFFFFPLFGNKLGIGFENWVEFLSSSPRQTESE